MFPKQPLARFEPPVERTEIQVREDILADYVGVYQLRPAMNIEITRDGSRLYLQAINQPKLERFAEAEGRFFLKVVDAQATFVGDEAGTVTGLVLYQNGVNVSARKLQ